MGIGAVYPKSKAEVKDVSFPARNLLDSMSTGAFDGASNAEHNFPGFYCKLFLPMSDKIRVSSSTRWISRKQWFPSRVARSATYRVPIKFINES
jgi:hypothetical protein